MGGGVVGAIAHWIGRWTREGVFGRDMASVGGGLEGLGLGAAARLLGEADPGPTTRAAVGAYQGFLFGAGLALGLTRRPRA
jgi:hypothetical protein